jgi:hypothetical protein
MKRWMVGAVLGLVAMGGTAHAQRVPVEGPDAEWDAAVLKCREQIRRTIQTDFDAYVPPGTAEVRFFGTPRANYEFRKCMEAVGQMTGPVRR